MQTVNLDSLSAEGPIPCELITQMNALTQLNALTQFAKAVQNVLELNQLSIDEQNPVKLVVRQRLKRGPYLFLLVWSILFAGIPIGLATWVFLETGARSTQFLGVLLLASPFILLGVLVAYVGLRSRTIILDKTNKLYIREVGTLLGIRTKTYDLKEIQAIHTQKSRHYRDQRVCHFYHLEISLRQGKKHRLPGMRQRQKVSDIVIRMQSFIQSA
ncbi:MAG: hypothetical protein F6K42_10550 [Leptolyngbya sp. SIO1D8]|nr:hypothetical protein [Leptolyngbya sp. SIO1D8]